MVKLDDNYITRFFFGSQFHTLNNRRDTGMIRNSASRIEFSPNKRYTFDLTFLELMYPLNLPFFIVPYVLQSRTMRSFEKVEDKFSRSFPLSFTSSENLLSSTETTNGKTLSTLRLLDFAEFHDSRF